MHDLTAGDRLLAGTLLVSFCGQRRAILGASIMKTCIDTDIVADVRVMASFRNTLAFKGQRYVNMPRRAGFSWHNVAFHSITPAVIKPPLGGSVTTVRG